jgi:hypothetical protein
MRRRLRALRPSGGSAGRTAGGSSVDDASTGHLSKQSDREHAEGTRARFQRARVPSVVQVVRGASGQLATPRNFDQP